MGRGEVEEEEKEEGGEAVGSLVCIYRYLYELSWPSWSARIIVTVE